MRSVRLRLAAGVGLVLALGGPIAGDSPIRGSGETFRSPVRGEAWRAVRDEVSGAKWFESPVGERADTPAEIALREWRTLPALERTVESSLAAAVTDPSRAAEAADVTILLRRQPAHDAGMDARAKYAPLFATPLARAREIVSRLDARRAVPGQADPAEDERLLTAEEKAALKSARDDVLSLTAQMRREVCERASAEAAADQAGVRAWLEARTDVTVFGSSWILSTVSARVPLGAIEALVAAFPEIARVSRCVRAEPTLNVSVPTISASTWWNAGYTGSSSTKVAVLDTGVDGSHPALTLANSAVYLGTAKNQSDFNDNANSTDDYYGHGTHVAGIVASNDSTNKGVAYGAGLMDAKCGYKTTSGGGSLQDPDIMGAGDWAATNGASVMNCSFGGGGTNDGSSSLALFFDAAVFNLSIDVAIASGNSGSSSGSVLTPGDAFNVVTAGNFDDNGTTTRSDDSLNSSSSRGPTNDGRRKPDVSAPGTNINSCNAFWEGSTADFISFTGTSMASPHIAGSLALLRDYAATWTPEGLKALLITSSRNTSPAPTSPDNNWGWGGLDLAKAYTDRASVLEGTLTSSGASDVFVRLGSLASGGRVTLAWNRHVLSNGSSAPVTSYSLIDVDLYVFDASTGASVGSSTSSVNPVEQVQASSAVTSPVARVSRVGSFPSGFSTEYYAVASETTTSASVVNPPALACSFASALPAVVGPASAFTLPVTVTNNGDLPAFAPVVTLTLPSGYSTTETNASVTIGTIAAGGGTGTATFHVTTSSGPTATKTIKATAATTSFGAQFTGATVSATQTLDADPPSGTISVDSGAAYTGTAGVTLTLSASDAIAGVDAMRLRSGGGAWTAWESVVASRAWTLAAGDGSQTVDVEFRDKVGNAAIASDAIGLDTTPPSGAVVLSGGAPYTSATSVSLATAASDAVSGVAEQRISTDGSTFGAWEAFGTTHTLSLPAAEGTTTRWAQFRDAVGNVSATVSSSVVRDVTPPTGSVVVNGGATFTNQTWVHVATAATDSASGVVAMRVGTNGNAWTAWFAYQATVDMQMPIADASNTVYAQYRDGAGNDSALYTAAIFVDSTGPTGTLEIEGGARYTAASSVTLTIAGVDASSGVAAMRVHNDGDAWGSWQAYSTSVPWTLSAGEGEKTVHVQFKDGAGNLSADVSAAITRDLTPPAGALTILGGAAAVNRSDVVLDLAATDAASGVAEVRVMNDGAGWSAWTPAADTLPFALTPGEGTRKVWAQFRDAVGNVSAPVSAEILVDTTPPTGSFSLNGGASMVLPWETLTADPSSDDGPGGSGVVSVEFSVDGGATWTAPQDASGPAPVDRLGTAIDAADEILARFRDAAGNVSAPSAESAYLVAAPVQSLGSARTLKGVIAPGGDVDAYTIELIQGDALTIRAAARSAKRRGALGADLDVYGPSREKLVDGRWPARAKKPGVARFVAPATGTYVVVVRPTGADAALGGSYTLAESVARPKARIRLRGTAGHDPNGGSPSVATASFAGTQGASISGTVSLSSPTLFDLAGPDGSVTELVATPKRGVARISLTLAGGTGSYTLSAKTFGVVPYSLTLNAARRAGSAVESPPAGQR